MKAVLKKSAIAVILLSLSILSLSSCKKDKDDAPSSDKFPLTNLTVTLTKQQVTTQSSVIVDYDVKNISNIDYTLEKYVNNPIKVKITVVTTDGIKFDGTNYVGDVLVGKTSASVLVVNYSAGKTVDATKTKAELIY